MGLLDQFGSFSPDDNQGLLAAAAQMLQASGPSRMPTSFGQVLGQGIGSYQNAMSAAQEAAQKKAMFEQAQAIGGLKLQDAQSDFKNQEAMREREARIQAAVNGDGMSSLPSAPASYASAMPGGDNSPNIGGPDWMQAYQQQKALTAPASPQAGAQQPEQQDIQATIVQKMLREAQIRAQYGDKDGAIKLTEAASKLQPKYSTDFRMAMGPDGQPHNYVLADNGQWKDTGLGVKPDVTEVDLGGMKQFVDKNRIAPNTILKKTLSPDAAASNSLGYARLNFDKSQAIDNQDAEMDPLAIRMTAQQYLAGDGSALQNFGRGAQGAKNLNAVRLEIAKQATAAGMSGADIAAKMAEFGGIKAGQRTAGTRSASIEIAANEVAQLAPLALDASSKVARSGFKPFGNAQIMFDSNTNDPNMRQFAMANTALVNAYGQAMARGGAATVSDKDHARELLSTTFDQPSYAAAVQQLQRETKAAQAAPKAVRKDLSNEVSGRTSEPASAPAANAPTMAQIPTANASNRGKVLVDHQTGKRFKSNGVQWQEIQ